MAGLTITTEPTQEPVTLQEVKEYLRIEDSTDERLLRPFIETARRFAEEHMGRTLMQTTYTMFVDAYDEMADPLWRPHFTMFYPQRMWFIPMPYW